MSESRDGTPSGQLTDEEVHRWTRIGRLSACAMLLSYTETFMPIPIPGVKLGLANVAVLVALATGDVSGAVCVAFIKVLAVGFLFGSPLTMAYSVVGTALALIGMVPLSRLKTMRLWMVSVVGALLHEVGQLLVAQVLLRTTAVWYALPVLLVAGCVTGAISGWFATQLAEALAEKDTPSSQNADASGLPTSDALDAEPQRHAFTYRDARKGLPLSYIMSHAPSIAALMLFCTFVAFAVIVLHMDNLAMLAVCVALALATCLVAHVDAHTLIRMVVPFAGIGAVTFLLQLLATGGNVEVAAVETTRGITSLAALSLAARAFANAVETDDLVGTLAWLLSPLSHLGVQIEGFLLAFDVALELVPTLADTARKSLVTSDGPLTLSELGRRLGQLARELL